MEYAYVFEGNIFVYGQSLQKINDFFDRPFKSSRLNIYISNGKKYEFCDIESANIKCKLFALPYKQNIVFVPLLHTLDS